jgi:hypothetical protein
VNAQAKQTRLATPEIKQTVIELTLQQANFSDFQITQIISERSAIRIARARINRQRHLAHFKFLPPKRNQFASDFINGKLPTQNLVFSDGSRFRKGPDNPWGWRRGEHEEGTFAERDKSLKISIH